MCTTCGCGGGAARIEDRPAGEGGFRRVDGTAGTAGEWHDHGDGALHRHVHGPLGAVHAPGVPAARIVQVEQDLLAANDGIAARNRARLAALQVFALNLVSSPGSGKTSLLVRTIELLQGRFPLAVIEGDQQTSRDAERIRATGAPAIQVNTGKGCHLDAAMVERALTALPPPRGGLLLIENVGNLVCPAAFDLGEAHKVVILSVTEGEDKPLKYPDMFSAADLCIVSKVDLLPYVTFDIEEAIENARRVRPGLEVLQVSATTGAGMEAWLAWLARGVDGTRGAHGAVVMDALGNAAPMAPAASSAA